MNATTKRVVGGAARTTERSTLVMRRELGDPMTPMAARAVRGLVHSMNEANRGSAGSMIAVMP